VVFVTLRSTEGLLKKLPSIFLPLNPPRGTLKPYSFKPPLGGWGVKSKDKTIVNISADFMEFRESLHPMGNIHP